MNDVRTLMMVTFNRLELTKQTIENIYNTTKNFEFIIIDNGSTDDTIKYLKSIDKTNIHLILNTSNLGIAIGRNQALKKADELGTKWYATIDNDIILPDNWLDDCIDILEKCKSYGAIGVSFENVNYPIVNINNFQFQDKPKGNLGTACMVFRKQLHQMLGFFTTEYERYGEEDADFGMRAHFAGFKLGYLKNKGKHIGEGEYDTGEYRKFKDDCRRKNLNLFYKNCALYAQGKKPLYISYKES